MKIDDAFQLIINQIQNESLKRLITQQYKEDKWGATISELSQVINAKSLNKYDHTVAQTFLARDLSLTYRYQECFEIIQNYKTLSSNLLNSDSDKALKGFMYHQFSISFG